MARTRKSHRTKGLFLTLIGTVVLLSWFHPVWIFNLFLVTRIIAGGLFPQFFQPPFTTASPIIPTVYL